MLDVASRVILLNGASSSGNSSLARAIQAAQPEPFLRLSPDLLRPGIPPVLTTTLSPALVDDWPPQILCWLRRRRRGNGRRGNDLIVELFLESTWHRQQLTQSLAGRDLYVIGVHCDLTEIDRREIDVATDLSAKAAQISSSYPSTPSAPTTSTSTRPDEIQPTSLPASSRHGTWAAPRCCSNDLILGRLAHQRRGRADCL